MLGERRSWQNKVPVSTKKETKTTGLFMTSNTHTIASTTAIRKAVLGFSMPQRAARAGRRRRAPRADFQHTPAPRLQPGLKGCSTSLSPGPKNISHFIFQNKHVSITCYCYLHEIKYLNQRKILFIIICKYHFNHKLNLKATLSMHDCYLVSIIKVPWKN